MSEINRVLLGHLVITGNALDLISLNDFETAVRRHSSKDWGDIGSEDRMLNDIAVASGGHLFSSYTSTSGVRFWLITEADRSVTTLLLPDNY
jgi:hypothetical protein